MTETFLDSSKTVAADANGIAVMIRVRMIINADVVLTKYFFIDKNPPKCAGGHSLPPIETFISV